MVMDQFVTTYRKDYLWPYIKTLGVRPHPEINQYNRENAVPCECHNIARRENNQHGHEQDILGPLAYQEESWSRLGPMGPLLDPKIYPAKVSSAPESHVSRFNQPNVFLQKLQEKYPFIYECLRTAPPDDLLARINKDRLSSTYQVDYCRKTDLLKRHPRNMLAASKEHVPNDNVLRNKALRQSTITKYFVESGMPSEKEMNKNRIKVFKIPPKNTPPEKTIYQLTIGKLGSSLLQKHS
ncbi:uncharacterized protein LOC143191875 isoform X3 [Rhynchophorus ferrugineus]|uniref:uncharacterized protein LOC143191875 isoform X3 n=1 Tax=Rhynchophorus ferrugineus TaxID=354439 RepID=UPI003FCE7E6D